MSKPLPSELSVSLDFITASKFVALSGFGGICYHCCFNTARYNDAQFSNYNVALPATLINAANSRKAEFLAGRIAARHAFIQLGLTPAIVDIGARREPQWPTTVLGSISHHGHSAFCMMMPRPSPTPLISLGIDVESIVLANDRDLLSPSIVSQEELELISASFVNMEFGFTVIFSAKEALFKALHPAVGRYFDFLDVKMSAIHIDRCELEFRLLTDLSVQLLKGHTVTVHWRNEANTIISWVLSS